MISRTWWKRGEKKQSIEKVKVVETSFPFLKAYREFVNGLITVKEYASFKGEINNNEFFETMKRVKEEIDDSPYLTDEEMLRVLEEEEKDKPW